MNRYGCYYYKPITDTDYVSEIEDYRILQKLASRQIIYYLGNFKIPRPWLSFCVCFSVDTALCACYRQTWETQTNMAGKYRCRDIEAPGNIEDYCESNVTFPLLLLPLIWPTACDVATADSHDVVVFLAH